MINSEEIPVIKEMGMPQELDSDIYQLFMAIFCEICYRQLSLMGMSTDLDIVSMVLFCDNDECERSNLRYRFKLPIAS